MLTIIGCGNPTRCDDGVGVAIAQRLQQVLTDRPVPGVQVFDCGTAGLEVMFRARGSTELILLDACSTSSEPGAVFTVPGSELETLHQPSYNLHDFRWDHALAAGHKIFGTAFPQKVTVYLIEAQTLDFGLELSQPVQRAAETVLQTLLQNHLPHGRMAEGSAP